MMLLVKLIWSYLNYLFCNEKSSYVELKTENADLKVQMTKLMPKKKRVKRKKLGYSEVIAIQVRLLYILYN